MKKAIVILIVAIVLGIVLNSFETKAQMGSGMMGPGMMGSGGTLGAQVPSTRTANASISLLQVNAVRK